MDLTLEPSPQGNIVRAYGERGARVGDDWYNAGLLMDRERLEAPWPVSRIEQIDTALAATLIGWQPALIVLGTGDSIRFPDQAFSARIMAAGIGLEIMSSDAACRTYNVLASENRAALLALMSPG